MSYPKLSIISEKMILYGKYRGGYIPSNNTKSDKTAEKAIKNVGKKG